MHDPHARVRCNPVTEVRSAEGGTSVTSSPRSSPSWRSPSAIRFAMRSLAVPIVVIGIVELDAVDFGKRWPVERSEPFTGEPFPELRLLPCFEHQVGLPAMPPEKRNRLVEASFLDVGPAEGRTSGIEADAAAVVQRNQRRIRGQRGDAFAGRAEAPLEVPDAEDVAGSAVRIENATRAVVRRPNTIRRAGAGARAISVTMTPAVSASKGSVAGSRKRVYHHASKTT